MKSSMFSCGFGFVVVDLIFFLYKTGESMLDATTRPYLVRAVCYEIFKDEEGHNVSTCLNLDNYPVLEDYVQSQSGNYLIYYRLLLNIPAIALSLFCGSYSDRYGRKIPIMLPSLGSVFAVLLYIASNLVPEHRIALILSGSAIQGFFGKSSVITMAVNSFVFDLSDPGDRTRNLGKLLAMNFFGLFMGSLFSGVFQDVLDLNAAFVSVVVLHGASIMFTIVLVNETIDRKEVDEEGQGYPCELCEVFRPSNIKDTLVVLFKPRSGNLRAIILTLFTISLVNQTCKVGEMDINLLFVTRSPLNWSKSWYGYLLSLDYAVMGLCLFIFLPLFSNKFMLSDVTIMILGIGCKFVRLIWAGFCDESWMVFVSVAIGAMAGMITSALRSLVSKAVHADEAGKMFSLLACGETCSKFLGTVIFVNLYSVTAHIFPGIAFMVEAFVYLILLGILILMFKELRNLQTCDLLQSLKEQPDYGATGSHQSKGVKNLPEIDEMEEDQPHPSMYPATTP
ncbi:lysosomal proton-coupled steroid conjugate and bile acid symporter SLC46A3-like [Crassostrea virginica]